LNQSYYDKDKVDFQAAAPDGVASSITRLSIYMGYKNE
jgi:hypothetical protein